MVNASRDLGNLIPVAISVLRYLSGVFFPVAAAAERSLLMFERDGCSYCKRWDAEIAPASAYGESKLMVERALDWADLDDFITARRVPVAG